MPVAAPTSSWRTARFVVRVLLVFNVTSAAFAATVTKVNDDALAPLRASVVAKKIRLDRLPLYDNKRSVIELEEFQVWTPDGKVVVHGDSGATHVAPPPMRFFRGSVNGDPESFAFFSVDGRNGRIEGLIDTRDMKFAVSAAARRPRKGGPALAPIDEPVDYFLTAADANDAIADDTTKWECALEQNEMKMKIPDGPIRATGQDGLPIKANGISGTQSYAITLEIETDYEFFLNAGSDVAAATNYITNLAGALSTIYNRDLKTNVTIAALNIYDNVADPWAAATASPGLNELGNYYHNAGLKPAGRTTSAVAMMSGKNVLSGVAWLGQICGTDGFNGTTWFGPYSWNGGIGAGALGTIPDPNGTNSQGTLYGLPSGTQNYWPLIQFAHELGHNMGSPHTHCMAITQAQFDASIFSDGSEVPPNNLNTANHYLDHCYAVEGAGCFAGTNYVAGSQTSYKGTIMSYCHNVNSGGIRQSRFTFGMIGQPSQVVYDGYLLNPAGPLSGFSNIVTGVGPFTISAITSPASVPPSSTGNAASITAIGGATYAWTITNGTITAGQGTNAITFTAGPSGTITLRASAYGADRCGVTDTKAVAIGGAPPPPSTNVVATVSSSTSVSVTWTLAAGATSYRVYRSAGGAYTQVGTPATPPYTDATAAANTAYLYKVRSFDGTTESTDSNIDLATTVIFTDPTLTPGSTQIKAAHFTEMRTAVNAVMTLAVQTPTAYTDPTLNSTVNVKAVHSTELRTRLISARSTLTLSAPTFTNTITGGTSTINALDMNELRAAVQ